MLIRIIWIVVSISTVSLVTAYSSLVGSFSPILYDHIELPQPSVSANPVRTSIDFDLNEARTVESKIKTVSAKDELCLRKNIYFEARNQSILGQIMVALVTIERKNSDGFRDDICSVVYQRKQFSWANHNKNRKPNLSNDQEREAWDKAGIIAALSLHYLDIDTPVMNVTHYHADYVNPEWSRHMTMVAKIDNHIFYKTDG